MLQSLHIVNFAVIEEAVIELSAGVTIFTGETGSGKSLFMEALAVVTGQKASTEYIRTGCESFQVEAVFTPERDEKLNMLLSQYGIDAGDGQLVILRKLNRSGRGICTVNGSFCAVKQLQAIGSRLIRMHEQNGNYELLSPDFCRWLLDHSSEVLRQKKEKYGSFYKKWKDLRDAVSAFTEKKQENERRLDILKWETEEIGKAGLKEREDEEIEEKLRILQNHEKIFTNLHRAADILENDEGVRNSLSEAGKYVSDVVPYDPSLSEMAETLSSAVYSLDDVVSRLESYLDAADFSEEELNGLQQRAEEITSLKRKYGPELADVLAYHERAVQEYDRLKELLFENDSIRKELNEAETAALQEAEQLNRERITQGARLCRAMEHILQDLGMPHAHMEFSVIPSQTPSAEGAEEVELLFTANPGEPPKPMRRIASGGEISRISLAVESVMSGLFTRNTLVFDEIDIGISGVAAVKTAEKIRELSKSVQILCVTHLPQTASIADRHYKLEKDTESGQTHTRIRRLTPDEHLREIAEMISGTENSVNALKSAEELQHIIKK